MDTGLEHISQVQENMESQGAFPAEVGIFYDPGIL